MTTPRNRYAVHMTYADGSPGLAFHPTLAAATAQAQAPTHGGRPLAEAVVCDYLSNGAMPERRTYRHDTTLGGRA